MYWILSKIADVNVLIIVKVSTVGDELNKMALKRASKCI